MKDALRIHLNNRSIGDGLPVFIGDALGGEDGGPVDGGLGIGVRGVTDGAQMRGIALCASRSSQVAAVGCEAWSPYRRHIRTRKGAAEQQWIECVRC